MHSITEDILIGIGASTVEMLIPLLKSDKWGERFGAILCLRDIGDTRAIQPMIELLAIGDINVNTDISEALDTFENSSVLPLLDALKHTNENIRAGAAFCIRKFRLYDVKSSLIELALHDEVYKVRESAIFSLSLYSGDDVTEILRSLIHDKDENIREFAEDLLNDREGKS